MAATKLLEKFCNLVQGFCLPLRYFFNETLHYHSLYNYSVEHNVLFVNIQKNTYRYKIGKKRGQKLKLHEVSKSLQNDDIFFI